MTKWRLVNFGNMVLILMTGLTFDIANCQLPNTPAYRSVVFKNIGIKLCQNKCVQSGFCRALEYTIPSLTCHLSEVDIDTVTNEAKHIVRVEDLVNVQAGLCQLKTCSNMRCLETRTGKTECVKEQWNKTQAYAEVNTTLIDACIMGNLEQVRNILSNGQENINSMGKGSMTPVMLAAREGHRKVFDLLVREDANLSLVDGEDRNILHVACVGGNVEIVKYVLLQKIGDIDSRDVNGWTPVMHAANAGHKGVFDILVEAGADLSTVTGGNVTILHVACSEGHKDITKILLKYDTMGIDKQDSAGFTPVMYAASAGHKDVFDVLVEGGANLSLVSVAKETILHEAGKGGTVEIIKYILTQEIVDIDTRDMNGWTPVMHGACNGHKNVFDVLVDKGARLSIVSEDQETILHAACEGGNVEIVSYLLTHDIADIDSRDMDGCTPVMLSANYGHKNVFNVLVDKGANLSIVSKNQETILHAACTGANFDIIKYLLTQDIVDVDSRDGSGVTPVMIAAKYNSDDIFELLVKWGADLSLLDDYNDNILHLACDHDRAEIVQFLLARNLVDINSRNGNGFTPAMIAAHMGHEAVFFLLVDHEADLTIVNDAGDNILNLACEGENLHIVKYVYTRHIVEEPHREENPC